MTGQQFRDDGAPHGRPPLLPAALALADAVLLLLSLGIWLTAQIPFRDLTGSYLLGDAAIGGGFALGGALITLRVRRNAVGWLMLAAGTLYLVAAAVGSLVYLRLDDGDGGSGSRALTGIFASVWFPAIAVLIPVAIQLFPTGRPINRFWAGYLVLTVVGGLFLSAGWILGPGLFRGTGLDDSGPLIPGGIPHWLEQVIGVGSLAGWTVAGSLLAPIVRLVRRPGEERLQVLWLVWAVAVVAVVNAPGFVGDVPPPVPLLAIPLIPLAMTAAVLRYRLYGITLVVNRTVVYLALTVTLLAGYLGVVYVLSRLISSGGLRQVLATGVVAVAFSPVRSALQKAVNRLMFGSAADPYGALADLGRRLQSSMTPDQVLPAIATTVADALKLPYVLVRAGRPGAEPVRTVVRGTLTGPTSQFPLTDHGEDVGTLVLAVDPHGTTGARRELLSDLVRQAGPAVHSVVLTEELHSSRQRTIAALEEERTRIRRDLHDGLGPALTGLVLKAEAARNLVVPEPGRAAELMGDVTEQTRSVLADIRRLVYGLRPPVLDRQGLRSALEGYVGRWGAGDGGPVLGLELPPDLPRLAPAVEVAAYRIVTEALANAVRHSTAASARARIWVEDDSLHLEVSDDGRTDGGWVPGVGLTSMRERTEELGGGFAASGSVSGGTVAAWLPLAERAAVP